MVNVRACDCGNSSMVGQYASMKPDLYDFSPTVVEIYALPSELMLIHKVNVDETKCDWNQ